MKKLEAVSALPRTVAVPDPVAGQIGLILMMKADLPALPGRGTAPAIPEGPGPIQLALRLKVQNRRITEADRRDGTGEQHAGRSQMSRVSIIIVLAVIALLPWHPSAQISNTAAPAVVGHFHLNVTSVEAHKKFWVDTLGGTATKFGSDNVDVITFPDVYLFLRAQAPSGPARGTALDHIGFAAPHVPAIVAKITAAGYQLTDGREPAPGASRGAPSGAQPQGGAIAYVLGPDGAKIEIVTNRDPNPPPLKYHHVHFINKQYVEMQQWYMKAFDATLRPGQTDFFIGADLPGVGYSLNFFRWEGDQAVTHAPTKGRVYDHVGFEVKNLEAFCRALEAKEIALTAPYRKAPGMNNAGTAMITDPWGVSIELTEGLR